MSELSKSTSQSVLVPMVVEQTGRGRARLRHLFPTAQGPDHFYWHTDRRSHRESGHCPDALPANGGRQKGSQPLHQLARRLRHRRPGDLRHDAVSHLRRDHLLPWHGREHGRRCLLCAGTKGKRFALPNSDIMIHQVSGGAQGQASDVERQVDYMFKLKKRLIKIISQHTGKSEEQVRLDSDRDYYMSAAEARDYGLVDEVIKSRKEVKLLDGAGGDGADRNVAVAEAALPRKLGE